MRHVPQSNSGRCVDPGIRVLMSDGRVACVNEKWTKCESIFQHNETQLMNYNFFGELYN